MEHKIKQTKEELDKLFFDVTSAAAKMEAGTPAAHEELQSFVRLITAHTNDIATYRKTHLRLVEKYQLVPIASRVNAAVLKMVGKHNAAIPVGEA